MTDPRSGKPDFIGHICSAEVYVEGDGGATSVRCNLPGNHEGEHEYHGSTMRGVNYVIRWEERTT